MLNAAVVTQIFPVNESMLEVKKALLRLLGLAEHHAVHTSLVLPDAQLLKSLRDLQSGRCHLVSLLISSPV